MSPKIGVIIITLVFLGSVARPATTLPASSATRPAPTSLFGYSSSRPAPSTQPTATTPDREMRQDAKIADLEKRIAILENQISQMTATTPSMPKPEVTSVQTGNAKDSPLLLDSWDYKFHEGSFGQDYYAITMNFRNAGSKEIKLIDASIRFTDLLDERLFGIKVSPDLKIPVGKTISDKGEYSINQFINEQSRMKGMKKEDIKATLEIRRIVFSDNSVLQIGK